MVGKLKDFRTATKNPNRHTKRGLAALEQSIREDGFVAPITVAADGESLDGSARLEVVADVLNAEPLVIEHDGTRPIIMKRTDIPNADSDIAKRIAVRANRVGQMDLEWDPEVLLQMPDELIESLWEPQELEALGDAWSDAKQANDKAGLAAPTNLEYRIVVDCASEEQQAELLARFETEGLTCRALIS